MIGLQRGKVSLSDHNPEWISNAQKVIQKLWRLLGSDAVDIQHVGSTSIRYVHAKPIIDIAVAVNDFDNLEKIRALLENNSISYICEDVSGQHLFACGNDVIRTHHIHFVLADSEAWHNYLNFRDYLTAHPDKAKDYDDLKRKLAALYSNDRTSYTAGKARLISELLEEAKQWRNMLDES